MLGTFRIFRLIGGNAAPLGRVIGPFGFCPRFSPKQKCQSATRLGGVNSARIRMFIGPAHYCGEDGLHDCRRFMPPDFRHPARGLG